MNRRYPRTRVHLLLALSLVATSASAAEPAPNFSQNVRLCNARLSAMVNITFGQSATTASVRATSESVKVNLSGPYTPFQHYNIQTFASVRNNPESEWSTNTATGSGTVGYVKPAVSSGHSTFKSATCQIKGVVYIVTGCPPESGMAADTEQVERTWNGCGL